MKYKSALLLFSLLLIGSTSAVLYYQQDDPNYGSVIIQDEISEYKYEIQQILNQEKSSSYPTLLELEVYKAEVNRVLSGQGSSQVPTIKAFPVEVN